ncbi:MAG TPA: DUF5054 domain-containing protein [Candidatus Dormibacteraeota bacterium]|jgi:hypothetical protein|nr:DUF5054 domain-containing protein [Candidatus Dormibacteraeota bacterium]
MRVHVVFKTHLDLGFTDLAARVEARYIEDFIPRAVRLARELRGREGGDRFIWTTGSWLIYEYLEQAAPDERRLMEEAIEAGDIAWHALPFTLHSELLDPSLFRFGLTLSDRLDRRFGRRTVAAKMSDVPGHTLGIVPLLAEAGVRFLHIGINGASSPVQVPPAFVWRLPDASSEILVVYHPGGYGGDYTAPGEGIALHFAHSGDNGGPPPPEEVAGVFAELRQNHPGATVEASTLDRFAHDLLPLSGGLPVITAEIGDTWIHGAGSDPGKVARFRELSRLRNEWERAGSLPPTGWGDRFSRFLLLVPEHTWGLDEKTRLDDYEHYSREDLAELRRTPAGMAMEASWAEQRAYLDRAVEALPPPQREEAEARLRTLDVVPPERTGLSPIEVGARVHTRHFDLALDGSGGIASLRSGDREWAVAERPLAQLRYEVFSDQNYQRFLFQYLVGGEDHRWWSVPDFSKPGIESAVREYGSWHPQLVWAGQAEEVWGRRLLLHLRMPEKPVALYGAPTEATLEIAAPDRGPELELTLQWVDKPACRLPEALWLSFPFLAPAEDGWTLEKLGLPVSPRHVVSRGARTLHAVSGRAAYTDTQGSAVLETLDAPLIAPGPPSLLDFNDRRPEPGQGPHVNLHNNVWGTNFPMWYGGPARFRFRIRLDRDRAAGR